jgi:5-hydroxyisourate hydrolase-like protein (transthyretin family)
MPGSSRIPHLSRPLHLAAAAGLLLALGGLALWGQSSQADPAPFASQTVAVFPADTKLVVALTLPNAAGQELTGALQVELVGAGGIILAKAQQAVSQKTRLASYHFELPAAKAKAGDLTLRCQFGKRQFETPLAKVLLARGQETSLITGKEFFAGSSAPFRCDVHGVRSVTKDVPLAGANVTIRLIAKDKAHVLYEGQTPADGRIEDDIHIPALPTGQYTLEVVTKSGLGEEKLQQAVQIKADAKILLISDKPVYQPGQEMHLRALVLRPMDLKPIENADLLFEVEDGKGNKVFKKAVQTTTFGVASCDFQLADEVNQGDYHLRAIVNDIRAEKTVNVKRYVLPRFKVAVIADKRFYLPKETVKVELQSDYFFGKPLAKAKVQVVASTFDLAFKEFARWHGQTDEAGHVKFDIKLPDYFVGQPLEHGNALVKLDVKVTDTADHSEQLVKKYTVSAQPIQVNLIPEGGKLVPGMANRLFAAAVYPDGSPAGACQVRLWIGKEAKGEPLATAKTNVAGLAEFTITPKAEQLHSGGWQQQTVEMLGGKQIMQAPQILFDVVAQAQDRQGNKAVAKIALNAQPLGENVLLRLNKAVYQSADTLEADIHTSAGLPTAFLDITRGGQLMLSKWLEVKDGRAHYKLDLPPGLFGSVEVHAYQMLASGEIIRDSRVIYVQPRNDLKVQVKASKDVYKPGESGRIHFIVTDSAGRPAQAALGVIVVDEAVYALQEMQPGLEKVYFTLQEELLKPQVQVKYKAVPLNQLIRRRILPPQQQQVAQVLLTAVQVQPPARWQLAPDVQRKDRYATQIRDLGEALYRYAWNKGDYMKYDADSGRWSFIPDVTGLLLRTGYVNQGMLTDPLGGKLSIEELARKEKGFTVDALDRSITQLRMKRLAAALVKLADSKKAEWYKDGRWTLPAMVLVDASRQIGMAAVGPQQAQPFFPGGGAFPGGAFRPGGRQLPARVFQPRPDENWLKDAWGQAFKLVQSGRKHRNPTGHSVFDRYDLISAGPDRDFETADDLRWTSLSGQQIAGWWTEQEANKALRSGLNQANLAGLMDRDNVWEARERAEQFRRLRLEDMQRAAIPRMAGGGMPGRPMAAKHAAEGPPSSNASKKGTGQGGGPAPITRVREYFPETLLWQPNLVTDENGVADLAISLADSITTWRLSASASSRMGALGSVQAPLKVFQDFFVEPDLPVSLTQNDEVAFPVAVYNYLKEPQTVKLELQQADWFELTDGQGLTRELKVQPGDVTSVKFRIRARKIGFQPLMVKAFGSTMSDAVKRMVEVVPDGQKVEKVYSDRLSGKVSHVLAIPADAVPDASKIMVRIYPGVMAQVLEGVDGLLRLPGG